MVANREYVSECGGISHFMKGEMSLEVGCFACRRAGVGSRVRWSHDAAKGAWAESLVSQFPVGDQGSDFTLHEV